MEAEVVRMVAEMYCGDEHVVGCITSGGTESIVMAVKAYRDWARDSRGIRRPEMVVPITAHVAFNKAAEYLGVTLIPVAVDQDTKQVELKSIWRACNRNTIMVLFIAALQIVYQIRLLLLHHSSRMARLILLRILLNSLSLNLFHFMWIVAWVDFFFHSLMLQAIMMSLLQILDFLGSRPSLVIRINTVLLPKELR